MHMLKFWMVLSSIVLGMALPVGRGYGQEEMFDTEIATAAIDDEQSPEQAVNEVPAKKIENEQVEGFQEGAEEIISEGSELKELASQDQKEVTAAPVGAVEEGEKAVAQEPELAVEEGEKAVAQEPELVVEEGEKAVAQEPELVVEEDEKAVVQELELAGEGEEDAGIASIDTVDLNEPQGNWLIKRLWFNKAEQLYEQMSQRVQRIFDFGSEFQQKSAELDQKLFDPFYLDIGIERGELTELVNSLIEQLTKNDELVAERDEEELKYFQQLEEEKGTLEQLKADIKGVSDIDSAVNNALATFNERANLSRNYHSKAWYLFQEIAHELNDKKARELYFTIKSLARSIIDIEEYITSPFSQYFDELSSKADEQINRIKQEVAVLEQRGIDLKKRVSELEGVQLEEELEEAVQQGYNTSELEQQKREAEERGFFSSIGGMVQYMWNTFYSFLQKLFATEKKQATQLELQQPEVEEQVVDVAPVGTEKALEVQSQEKPLVEPVVETKEVESELASDVEQQEAMTAGSEEVELIKATEKIEALEGEISAVEEDDSLVESAMSDSKESPVMSQSEVQSEQEAQ